VLKEATRLAHGGTGDVKTEWFEDIFGKGLEKYEKLKEELMEEVRKQDSLLEEIRVSLITRFSITIHCSVIDSGHTHETRARACTNMW
jgi:hypothetical protein